MKAPLGATVSIFRTFVEKTRTKVKRFVTLIVLGETKAAGWKNGRFKV